MVSQSREVLALFRLRECLCLVELVTVDQQRPDMSRLVSAWGVRPGILCELAFQCLRLALLAILEQAKAYLRCLPYKAY
jgi:hypothetical protein